MSSDIILHSEDLPESVKLVGDLAIDTEAMGLNISRDRLCLVQLCDERRKEVHLVQFKSSSLYEAPVLCSYLSDPLRQKIFHFARFDVTIMRHYLKLESIPNVFCTKIASKFARTYTDHHGLKSLVSDLMDVDLKKEQQCSNWGAEKLTIMQQNYAKNDVYYLHSMREKLKNILSKAGRLSLCEKYCLFMNTLVDADLAGFTNDIFSHI